MVIVDGSDPASIVRSLLPKYVDCLKMLAALGVPEVQIHDPVLVKSGMAAQWKPIFEEAYKAMSQAGVPLNLVTYFDDLEESFSFVSQLPVAKISMDFTTGNNLDIIKSGKFPKDKQLGAGVVDALTPFVLLGKASSIISELNKCGLAKPFVVQASSSLMYLPYDVNAEPAFSPALKETLGFAIQKLANIVFLAKGGQGPASSGIANKPVVVPEAYYSRKDPAATRLALQADELSLPKLWTSSIGSFPQTPEMRAIRLKFRKGEVSEEEYDKKVNEYISYCVGVQEAVGLDVLVHGEPERSDMVEYFAEQLDGFAFSQYGWVQSYGSRYTRPPIVVKDITHVKPMTVKEWKVAQSWAGKKYVKGMLTGPITILNWSFPRKDITKEEQALQLGLALRAEIDALQAAGCRIIQVDDPALREGMPLRAARQQIYLEGAVKAFRLTCGSAASGTRIITHFCYSEFGEILDHIAAMDADEITIESSRSSEEGVKTVKGLLKACSSNISPGVWDVHSPEVPSCDEIAQLLGLYTVGLTKAEMSRVGVVPDCGCKTRKWPETIASLRNMVKATQTMRPKLLA